MQPQEMFNRAVTAASVAEASGFEKTALAFLELALGIYGRIDSPERRMFPDGIPEVLGERQVVDTPTCNSCEIAPVLNGLFT